MFKKFKIPEATVGRLTAYSRFLKEAEEKGISTVSSQQIAKATGVTPAQVRKDLAYFGEFGTRGVGYNPRELYNYIMKILGLDRRWPVIIIGAGRLGAALAMYKGFAERGFDIVGIFDIDPEKIGSKIGEIEIRPLEELKEKVQKCPVKLGIVAVPAASAQQVVDYMVESGIRGIINFAPVNVSVPEGVVLRRVDLASQLEYLTFRLGESR